MHLILTGIQNDQSAVDHLLEKLNHLECDCLIPNTQFSLIGAL